MEQAVSYQRYNSYKAANSDWLAEVPSHWKLQPGLAVVKENKDKNKGMVEDTVLSLSYGRVIVKPPEKLTGLVPESFETYQVIRPNDIIIRPTDLQNDHTSLRTGIAKNHGIITSAYICLRPDPKHSPSYIHYLLHAYDLLKVFYGMGSGLRQNLDYRDFKRMELCLATRDEQDRIADFLDQKTAEIDEAIAKKQRLIELLKEQKSILINQTVTKGLNPDVPMRDSGVEWIGKVPEHWESKRLKFLLDVKGRIGFRGYTTDDLVESGDGALTLGASHITDDGYLNLSNPVYISWQKYNESPEIMVNNEDLLVVQRGSTCGKVGYVETQEQFITINPSLVLLKNISTNPKFILYAILAMRKYIDMLVSSTAIPMLSQEQIGNFSIPLPPEREMAEIISYIETAEVSYSQAIHLQKASISTLIEYKATIVADTVTGKIKL